MNLNIYSLKWKKVFLKKININCVCKVYSKFKFEQKQYIVHTSQVINGKYELFCNNSWYSRYKIELLEYKINDVTKNVKFVNLSV